MSKEEASGTDYTKDSEEDFYNWEEQDYEENKYMYEYDLEGLEDMPKREKM